MPKSIVNTLNMLIVTCTSSLFSSTPNGIETKVPLLTCNHNLPTFLIAMNGDLLLLFQVMMFKLHPIGKRRGWVDA